MRSTVGIPLLPAQAVAEGQGGGGCQLIFHMIEKSSGREVARGKQGIVFVDPVHKKVGLLPLVLQARLSAL